MLSAERLNLRDAPWPMLAATRRPPLLPRAAGGLSGRPRCRIYPVGRLWVLQVEAASGWLHGPVEPPPRLIFPTLAAAVAFDEQHGYDYRIITPSPVAYIAKRVGSIGPHRGKAATTRANGRSNTET
jgi:hypothetical protein